MTSEGTYGGGEASGTSSFFTGGECGASALGSTCPSPPPKGASPACAARATAFFFF